MAEPKVVLMPTASNVARVVGGAVGATVVSTGASVVSGAAVVFANGGSVSAESVEPGEHAASAMAAAAITPIDQRPMGDDPSGGFAEEARGHRRVDPWPILDRVVVGVPTTAPAVPWWCRNTCGAGT